MKSERASESVSEFVSERTRLNGMENLKSKRKETSSFAELKNAVFLRFNMIIFIMELLLLLLMLMLLLECVCIV